MVKLPKALFIVVLVLLCNCGFWMISIIMDTSILQVPLAKGLLIVLAILAVIAWVAGMVVVKDTDHE